MVSKDVAEGRERAAEQPVKRQAKREERPPSRDDFGQATDRGPTGTELSRHDGSWPPIGSGGVTTP